jgi:hypothetical protein
MGKFLAEDARGDALPLKRKSDFAEDHQTGEAENANIHKEEHRQHQPLTRRDRLDCLEELGFGWWRRFGRWFRGEHLLPQIIHARTS